MSAEPRGGGRFSVIVVGAGVGGICAAVQCARLGVATLLLEQNASIGGTGVHSPLALICGFRSRTVGPVNFGLHQELFPEAYDDSKDGRVPVYDHQELQHRYERLIAAEPLLEVRTSSEVVRANREGRRVVSVEVRDPHGVEEIGADFFLDGTADGNLSALAGAEFQKGRSSDGAMQPATLTFLLEGIDRSRLLQPDIGSWEGISSFWKELAPYYENLRSKPGNDGLRENVLCFPYPDGKRVLFNQTRICGVDPTVPETVERAMEVGRRQIEEFFEAVRRHPALQRARVAFIAEKLGIREGRRIVGEYLLTAEDCLGEARFEDMVAACAYDIDIHNPAGRGTVIRQIPGSGYYHIPYRALIPRGLGNLLLVSRCISGTHEAHSSYRVMSAVSAIGQAGGAAAALAVRAGVSETREVQPAWIRFELARIKQFVEGPREIPPTTGS